MIGIVYYYLAMGQLELQQINKKTCDGIDMMISYKSKVKEFTKGLKVFTVPSTSNSNGYQ
jgi:hypothetical protein